MVSGYARPYPEPGFADERVSAALEGRADLAEAGRYSRSPDFRKLCMATMAG